MASSHIFLNFEEHAVFVTRVAAPTRFFIINGRAPGDVPPEIAWRRELPGQDYHYVQYAATLAIPTTGEIITVRNVDPLGRVAEVFTDYL